THRRRRLLAPRPRRPSPEGRVPRMKELSAEVARQRLVRDILAAPPRERFVMRTEITARLLGQIRDDPKRAQDAAHLRRELAERLETQRVAGLYLERRLPPRSEVSDWAVHDAVHQVLGRDVGPDQVRRRRLVRE